MTGRREARVPSWGHGREVGWLWVRLLVGFGLAMASFGVVGMVVAAAVRDWRRVWLLLVWLPVWLMCSGGVWLVGVWVFRPGLLEGWQWPWQERNPL